MPYLVYFHMANYIARPQLQPRARPQNPSDKRLFEVNPRKIKYLARCRRLPLIHLFIPEKHLIALLEIPLLVGPKDFCTVSKHPKQPITLLQEPEGKSPQPRHTSGRESPLLSYTKNIISSFSCQSRGTVSNAIHRPPISFVAAALSTCLIVLRPSPRPCSAHDTYRLRIQKTLPSAGSSAPLSCLLNCVSRSGSFSSAMWPMGRKSACVGVEDVVNLSPVCWRRGGYVAVSLRRVLSCCSYKTFLSQTAAWRENVRWGIFPRAPPRRRLCPHTSPPEPISHHQHLFQKKNK